VSAARDFGFEFLGRTSATMTVKMASSPAQTYKLHALIPFDSARKRMSVVVETPGGKFVLYTKGADNIMLERAKAGFDPAVLNEHLSSYAQVGLRTLVLAKKDLSASFFKAWIKKWNDACAALGNRDELMAGVAAEVEKELDIVGATAIEDALQDDVANTIDDLMSCGIKLWVLTGDKMETAINIGYSCKLLKEDMTLIKLQVRACERASERADGASAPKLTLARASGAVERAKDFPSLAPGSRRPAFSCSRA
jgi:magnesium-transporting ATPase (P-type)